MFDFLNQLSPVEKFKETYSRDLFEKIGLPRDVIPHMTTPLPCEKGEVKERFRDYKTLARLWFVRAFLYRYERKRPITTHPIVLFTWVMTDGWGDFITQVEVAECIKEAFPELDVHLVSLFEASRKYIVFDLPCTVHVIPYKGHDRAEISEEVWGVMKKASLILQVPTMYPYWKEIEKEVRKDSSPEMLTVGEYGFIDSDCFHPESGALCMGVHSLEQGLLFSRLIVAKEEDFYFAYLKSSRSAAVYLHALFTREKELQKEIFVIFIDALPLLQALEIESWKGYGIKEIVIVDDRQRHVIKIENKGKIVTLEKRGNLTSLEVKTLIVQSKSFVGCRGNRSFSEVVIANKVFFYDAPRHSRPFLQDLLILVQKELPEQPSLENYLKLMLDTTSVPCELGQKIGESLLDRSLIRGIEKLHDILQKNYSFNRSLLNLVVQKTHHYFFPHQKKSDQLLLEELIEEKVALQDIYL